MTGAEFKQLMSEVTDYYGDKTYSPKMLGVIWRIMEPLSLRQGRVVVEGIIGKHARPPMPAAFKAEATPFLALAYQARRQEAVKAIGHCRVCGGSGQMLALLKEKPAYEFSFACTYCSAADTLGLSIPPWRDELKEKYVPVSLRPESFLGAKELQERSLRPTVVKTWKALLEKQPSLLLGFARHQPAGAARVKEILAEAGLSHLIKTHDKEEDRK